MNFIAIFFACGLVFGKAIGASSDAVYSKPINGQCPDRCFKVIGIDHSVQCDCCGSKENGGEPYLEPCAMARCAACTSAMCPNETICGNAILSLCVEPCITYSSPCPKETSEVLDDCRTCIMPGNTCKKISCPFGCYKYLGRDGCHHCKCCNGCVNKYCGKGSECVLREVICKKAPCPPQATCEPIIVRKG